MTGLLRTLFSIREGEGFKSLVMFSYGFMVIASLSILKPVSNYLFLDRIGVEKLPYALVLMAFCAFLVGSLYSKYSKKVRLNQLIFMTLLFSLLCLIGFWFLLHTRYQGGWLFYAFYIWVAIFGVVAGSQFWLLTNYIYNAREARRLFGFIGAGTISGGIFGGYLTRLLAQPLGSENLLFFCMVFLIICQALVWRAWRERMRLPSRRMPFRSQAEYRTTRFENPLKWLFQSRHLVYYAGLIAMGVIVAALADYIFRAVASGAYQGDRLTAFFGFWASTVNVISLIIQLFLTSRITKRLGVTASLFFLPAGLMLGAVAVLLSPVLWSAVLIRITDGGFKHSINKAATELLAFPIPQEIKKKARAFLDVFVCNFAEGLGGIILIFVTINLGLSIRYISLVIIGLLVLWATMIIRVRHEYIDSFRQAIEKRAIDVDELSLKLEDATALSDILKVLEGNNVRAILYALRLLEGVKNPELVPHMKRLIKHPSDEVKILILQMASGHEELDLSVEARHLAEQGSRTVRTQAVCSLYNASGKDLAVLKAYLERDDVHMNIAAVSCIASDWKENKKLREAVDLPSLVDGMLRKIRDVESGAERTSLKIQLATIIGDAKDKKLHGYLNLFLQDQHPEVKKAAIFSIKQIPTIEFVPALIEHLIAKHIRKYVRETLAEFGEDIIDTLAPILEDENQHKRKRVEIPKVFSLIGSQRSVSFLQKKLEFRDLDLRYQVIRALNRLSLEYPELRFDHQYVKARITEEIGLFQTTFRIWLELKGASVGAVSAGRSTDEENRVQKVRSLLVRALEERLDNILERIFRLLGLKYSPKDMLNAYFGLISDKDYLRANAIEFLDNILETSLKRTLIPLVESSRSDLQKYEGKSFQPDIAGEEESLEIILRGDDNWLKACAMHLAAALGLTKFIDSIQPLTNSPDPLMRETAVVCLKKLARPVFD
jgi:AAA family ATP:ADP antiporter